MVIHQLTLSPFSFSLCKLIPVNFFGKKLSNGSYVGTLKLIQEEKVDLYQRPELLGSDEPFLSYSQTVHHSKLSVGQIAVDLSKDAQSALSTMNLESSVKSLAIAALLLTLLLLAKLVQRGSFLNGLELVTRNLFEFNFSLSRSFSYLGFIVVFYNLYFLIFKTILASNIKTNKVIVNSSVIVDGLDDLGGWFT